MLTTLIWMVNTGIIVTEDMSRGDPVNFWKAFINEVTGAYSFLLILPALIWFFRRYPLTLAEWHRRLGGHLAAILLFGCCHTGLMILSRKLIYVLAGWPGYDPGILGYRFLMEFQKQFLSYWFVYGIFAIFTYIRANQERRIRSSVLEKQLTQARLQALKMQLNPHFLFNTLNMISSMMYEDIQRADRMIVHLCDLLRQTLGTGDAQQASLENELSLLDSYLKIMKERFEARLTVSLDIDEKTRHALFPSLTLQPLVENSVKHGMDRAGHVTRVSIQARKQGRHLQVSVRDNGPGLPGDPADPAGAGGTGIGLGTTRDRLAQLYGSRHSFEMANHPDGGLIVTIRIPFERETEAP